MRIIYSILGALKAIWWVVPFGVVIVLFLAFFFGYVPFIPSDLPSKGLFGDSFGALNSLFSGLGFAGLVVTLIFQQRQIKQQSIEFKEQLSDAAVRRYEENLFQVFAFYQDALSSVIVTKDGKTTKGRDALEMAVDSFLKRVRIEGSNLIPSGIQARYRDGCLSQQDQNILDYLYYRNFWHLNYSFTRQGRLIETLKVLLRHLEDKAPANTDVESLREIMLSQLTYVEVSYFFFIALGFRDESELRDLMAKSGLIKRASNIYKLQIHRNMYEEFWGHDLRRDKQIKSLPLSQSKIKLIKRSQRETREILESLKPVVKAPLG